MKIARITVVIEADRLDNQALHRIAEDVASAALGKGRIERRVEVYDQTGAMMTESVRRFP